MICLFLDDERNPEDVTWADYPVDVEFIVVRTFRDFLGEILFLTMHEPQFMVSLDHDIQDFRTNGQEATGYDCVKALVELLLDYKAPPDVTLFAHTQNPVGKKNILSYWQNYLNFKGE